MTISNYHHSKAAAEKIAGFIVGAALFVGMLCLMLEYFDCLAK
jgi:hypothetical protein